MAYDLYPAPRAKLLGEPIRVEDVRANILRALRVMDETVRVACSVAEAVQSWGGKRVTKRIAEDVKACINNGYHCSYVKDAIFDRAQLHIWSTNPDAALTYNNRMVLTVGEKESDFRFDFVAFEQKELGRYVKNNTESIVELKESLVDLDARVDAYNRALPGFREVLSALGRVYHAAFERT